MPAIRSMHLECCSFTASDRDYAEPFSTRQNSHPFFTSCNLSLVEKLTINTFGTTCSERTELLILSWLQLLTNLKTLTLSEISLKILLQVSYYGFPLYLFIFHKAYKILLFSIFTISVGYIKTSCIEH